MILLILLLLLALAIFCRGRARAYPKNAVGFLHPSSGAGGGGERVLWTAVDALQRADISKGISRQYIVFTNEYSSGNSSSSLNSDEHLKSLVERQFSVRLPLPVRFVYLRQRYTRWLNGDAYPCLTLFLQTFWGGAALFYELAVVKGAPSLVVETVGTPFVYPLLRVLAGSRVISYTHYPMISSVMRERVRQGLASHNKVSSIARKPLLCMAKVIYYQTFALLYRVMGWFPSMVLTNSSWTQKHMQSLFWPRRCHRLYPPCDVKRFHAVSRSLELRSSRIVSVGQFRPEKNHMLQLSAFYSALPRLPADAKLVMIGGARNEEDRRRVAALHDRVKTLGITERVEIHVDAAMWEVREELGQCTVGLHTMRDEHFGIVMLEYLAAGCIPLGHRSGGVELDIITSPDLGFLAVTEEEYAEAMVNICEMRICDPERYRGYQQRGSEHVLAFGDDIFCDNFVKLIAHFVFEN